MTDQPTEKLIRVPESRIAALEAENTRLREVLCYLAGILRRPGSSDLQLRLEAIVVVDEALDEIREKMENTDGGTR